MQGFRHIEAPLRLFAGDDCLRALDKELARRGCGRAAILCGRSMARDPALDMVRKAAGDWCAGVIEGVRAHSPRQSVEAVASELQALGADAVIAVGGGSAMVTARAAVIALGEGKPLDQLCTRRDAQGKMHSPRLDAPKMPIFAMPTTPSTATIKPGTAIFDEAAGARLALFDPATRPEAVFLDPALLMTAPADLMRGAALNTLCSAVEGLASGSPDQIALAMLIHAVRLCTAGLGRAHDDGLGRSDLAMSAILTGRGTDNTGMGLATVVSHAVAKAFDVDGGTAKATALPHVLRFNRDHIGAGRAALAQALGVEDSEIESALARIFADIGVPPRLRDLDVPEARLPEIAETCMGDWFLRTNPRPIRHADELMELLRAAW